MTRDRLWTLMKVAISLTLIVWLFLRVDIDAVWSALRRTDVALLLLAMILYLGAVASNALKWGVLLRAQGVKAPPSALLRHTFVAVFFANFMPFIGADMIRGYGLTKEVSRGADVAVSVLVDRLIGLLVFATTATISALVAVRLFGMEEEALLVAEQVGIVVTVALLFGFSLLLSGRLRRLVERMVARVPLLERIVPLVNQLSHAVGYYRSHPMALVAAYGVGLTTIMLSNVVNWLLFLAIGDKVIALLHVFIFNPIVGLGMVLPISIGGIGVNQTIFPYLYGLVGVAEGNAVAASLLLQLTIMLTSLPGGMLWLRQRERANRDAVVGDALQAGE